MICILIAKINKFLLFIVDVCYCQGYIRGFDQILFNLFPQTPWNPRVEMPIEAASVHFLIGMCHSELGRPLGALDAFNNAIRVNPDFAEVF